MNKNILVLIVAGMLFMFAGCKNNEDKPVNFSSQAEAQASLNQGGSEDISQIADLSTVEDLAKSFNGSGSINFNKSRLNRSKNLNKKSSLQSFGYDPVTHYWSVDTTVTEDGNTIHIAGKVRFTNRNIFGLPTETTDMMEFSVDISANGSTDTSQLDLTAGQDFAVTGISNYRGSTGNLTINGSESFNYDLSLTTPNGNVALSADYSTSANAIVLSPISEYPLSGNIGFTSKWSVTAGNGIDSGFQSHNVRGSITFDGTHIATLVYGGFTFYIDLDTDEITPA